MGEKLTIRIGGMTCTMCAQTIEKALSKSVAATFFIGGEFDYFATGHYARVEYDESQCRYLLKKAKDIRKD